MKNDPAFPCDSMIAHELETKKLMKITDGFPGLTKRELFAAMTMQGLLSDTGNADWDRITMEKAAAASVRSADALIAELEKTK